MKKALALFCLMLLLVACARRAQPEPTLTPTDTLTAPPPTRTLAPTHTPYPPAKPTKTPAPTSTPVPEPTATSRPPEPPAGTTRVLEPAGITLVYVPSGEFTMGSLDLPLDPYSHLGKPHRVYLDAYWIGQTEVTNEQYRRFVEDGGYATPEYWTPEGWKWKKDTGATEPEGLGAGAGQEPVHAVFWYEAAAFARWAGGSLPSEAQWEYACRGPQGLTYPWGDAFECWRGNFDDETERDDNCVAGGAGCEWLFGYGYPHHDISCEDWRSRDRMWDQTRHALEFFHRYLPFPEMRHADELATAQGAFCLAKPGEIYALYLPAGGTSSIRLEPGRYEVRWYDPRAGGELQSGTVTLAEGPGPASIGLPTADPERDWVVLVRRSER